jgi:hypothetical protein
MKEDDEIIESLIAGGLIGAALGALLAKNKEEGATLGVLVGATILGTYRANEKASKTHVPMVTEENGKLYQINTDSTKTFLRNIEKPSVKLQERFKLK